MEMEWIVVSVPGLEREMHMGRVKHVSRREQGIDWMLGGLLHNPLATCARSFRYVVCWAKSLPTR